MDIKKQLQEFYDNNADIRENKEKNWWKLILRERFLNFLKERDFKRFLEIGAGTGQDSCYFKDNGMDVTCIDLSPVHVRYCIEKGLDAKVADFYGMDFEDGSFQGVYAMNCLLHVPFEELIGVLGEIKRVLYDDGVVFIGNYGGKDCETVLEASNGVGLRFFSSITFERYKKKLEDADFCILESGLLEPEDGFSFNYYILGKNISGGQD